MLFYGVVVGPRAALFAYVYCLEHATVRAWPTLIFLMSVCLLVLECCLRTNNAVAIAETIFFRLEMITDQLTAIAGLLTFAVSALNLENVWRKQRSRGAKFAPIFQANLRAWCRIFSAVIALVTARHCMNVLCSRANFLSGCVRPCYAHIRWMSCVVVWDRSGENIHELGSIKKVYYYIRSASEQQARHFRVGLG